jgi:hypothetical protein
MEVESQRLAVFVMGDHKVGHGLRLGDGNISVARLFALGFLLGLFNAFFLPGTFFLALGKGCTRASCHNPQSSLDVVNLIDFLSKRFNVHR